MLVQERDLESMSGLLRFTQLLLEHFEALACDCAKISPPPEMLYAVQETLASVRVITPLQLLEDVFNPSDQLLICERQDVLLIEESQVSPCP